MFDFVGFYKAYYFGVRVGTEFSSFLRFVSDLPDLKDFRAF